MSDDKVAVIHPDERASVESSTGDGDTPEKFMAHMLALKAAVHISSFSY